MPEPTERYILLPARSLTGDSPLVSHSARLFLSGPTLGRPKRAQPPRPSDALAHLSPANVRLVDSIGRAGAKLVDVTPAGLHELKTHQPGLQVVPVHWYEPALQPNVRPKKPDRQAKTKIQLQVLDARTGQPVPRVQVAAITHKTRETGAEGTTNAQGQVTLQLPASGQVERLHLYPCCGYWSQFLEDVTLTNDAALQLTPIDLAERDALRACYPRCRLHDGQGVRVGVLDTGIAAHPDLHLSGGYNAVPFEEADEWGDNGQGHGTHVAGIIGGRGTAPHGLRGLAPGVELRSYRIFADRSGSASSWAIAKAIHQAILDGCDLLNLSLGGGPHDPTLQTAVRDARQHGCVLFCASGNDGRAPVSYPASDPLVVAVSAFGREGTYPPQAEHHRNILRPPAARKAADYIPAFANVGPELSLIAPGDGIVSAFPGGYAVLAGTSMACPAALARAAVLLSAHPAILASPRNVDRADAITSLALRAAQPLGFGPNYEGHGLLP